MEITWVKVVVFAGTSGVLSAVVGHALTLYNDWRNKSRSAAYLAIRIATSLEGFADECMTVIGDSETARQSNGAAGNQTTKLPELTAFPSDEVGWRVLPARLTANLLAFPNHIKAGQDKISFTASVAGELAAYEDCEEESARLGLQSWSLAAELRKQFRFPPFEPRYDIEGALRTQVAFWNEQ